MLKLLDSSLSSLKYEFWPALEEKSKKLLIVLHGRGDSPEGFHFLPAALGIDAFNFLFLQAPDPYYSGYSWYDPSPNQGPGIVRSRKLISDLLDKIQLEENISSTDIFLFGFSQGSLMCLDVALRYPKHLGGIIGASGYVFFEEEYPEAFSKVAREQKLWVSHGRQDEVLDFDKSRLSIERLRELGISIDWNPIDKGHTIDEVDEIPHMKLFLQRLLDAN
ncbi:MAG: serine esterase [Bdellovibrionota bacterium]